MNESEIPVVPPDPDRALRKMLRALWVAYLFVATGAIAWLAANGGRHLMGVLTALFLLLLPGSLAVIVRLARTSGLRFAAATRGDGSQPGDKTHWTLRLLVISFLLMLIAGAAWLAGVDVHPLEGLRTLRRTTLSEVPQQRVRTGRASYSYYQLRFRDYPASFQLRDNYYEWAGNPRVLADLRPGDQVDVLIQEADVSKLLDPSRTIEVINLQLQRSLLYPQEKRNGSMDRRNRNRVLYAIWVYCAACAFMTGRLLAVARSGEDAGRA